MKRNKGIVLVSLIITIIVIIILTNLVLNLSTGDDGIVSKSEHGARVYKQEMAKEDIVLAWDAITIEYEGNNSPEKNKADYFTQENVSKNVKNNGIILDFKYGDNFTTLKYATYSDGTIYEMMVDNSSVLVTNRTYLDKQNSKYLVDNVEIGDYVDIGINYNNVDMALFNSQYVNGNYGEKGPLGWRVLSKNRFGVTGEVTLISAGCPLEFWYSNTDFQSSMSLLDNLYTTIITENIPNNVQDVNDDFFVKNGFNSDNLVEEFDRCSFINKDYGIHGVTMDEIFDSYQVLMGEEKNFKSFLNSSDDSLLTSNLIKKNNEFNDRAIDLLANGMDYGVSGFYKNNNYCKVLANGKTKVINNKNSNLCLVRPVITLKYNVVLDENNTGDGSSYSSAYTIKFGEY